MSVQRYTSNLADGLG